MPRKKKHDRPPTPKKPERGADPLRKVLRAGDIVTARLDLAAPGVDFGDPELDEPRIPLASRGDRLVVRQILTEKQDTQIYVFTISVQRGEERPFWATRSELEFVERPQLPPVTDLPVRTWHGCYGYDWKGHVPPAVFKHPAKYSFKLIERIYIHALKRGYMQPGDVVGDPFGGVALGGYMARRHGVHWVGCELEPAFVEIGKSVIDYQTAREADLWKLRHKAPMATATLIQGDSRTFATNVAAIVSSPPYADSLRKYKDGIDWEKAVRETGQGGEHQKPGASCHSTYGDEPGQIGHLHEGNLGAVIASPPFTPTKGGAQGIAVDGYDGKDGKVEREMRSRHYLGAQADRLPANIEKLPEGMLPVVIASPPYANIASGNGGLNHLPATGSQQGGRAAGDSQTSDHRYGSTPGQLAKLPEGELGAIVASPPYEANQARGHVGAERFKDPEEFARKMAASGKGHSASVEGRMRQLERDKDKHYGDEPGQIGKDAGETYWQAMALVYRACFDAMRPGGFIMIVVKDYVKKKKRVPLCDNTLRLLEAVGFVGVERIRAMLVEKTKSPDLFAGTVTTTKQRKSFFRRLAESNGAPKIDFEEVIICQKPTPKKDHV